ncbi:LysR family transcriptional regulator [Neobacillus terrae]|uniref:LysR substrate-binding domain-containing protein n=1 Tax=Neobacillus terrae TaxID=3034837 RepID=UPI001407B3B6|nr:LysR family transcriptional regulator [Neobacillus terrae]NHM31156.1 LysR family transcriptional regulator [Neobacillus terrae]
MEIRHLRYFLEVGKQKSVTRAAETLHISQPALSKMIKSLEDEIGIPLMIRSNKQNEITDAGNVVMEYAQKMTSLMDEMNTTLNDMTNLKRGRIHIGLPPIIGSLFFPKVMAKFHRDYPNIEIKITEYGGARVVKSVEEGEFELGVAVLPIDEKELNVFPFLAEEMRLLVPYSHRYANREYVELKELVDEEFIFYHEEFSLHDIMRKKFINEGFEPKILFKTSQWDFMTEMVAAQMGVTILPESICERASHEDLKQIKLNPPVMWELAVITRKDRYLSYAGRKLINFILTQIES